MLMSTALTPFTGVLSATVARGEPPTGRGNANETFDAKPITNH
jgi:hypothetical protein